MSSVTWLHLSDWHQKDDEFDRKVVCDALIKDLQNRKAIDSTVEQIDFVVFSGDATFSGKQVEFAAAKKYLFDPVLETVGLKSAGTKKAERLFFVPGNHDLSRDCVYEMLPPELQKPLNSDGQVQKWLHGNKLLRTMEPFEAYKAFVAEYTGQTSPDFASVIRFEAGGKQVALLGINSSWMSARNFDAQGEVYDYGYSLIGEPQIHDALAQIADANLRITVMHHPFDWLATFDRNHVESQLVRECHFILRGHEHHQQVQVIKSTFGECVIIPAGASYKRRIAENPRYTNAYNLVHLDFATGRGTVFLRRWSDQKNSWIEDIEAQALGKFSFDLPKELLGTTPFDEVSTQKNRSISCPVHKETEDRYRTLLLETCDIITLANLPEQDRHLVQRQLELRRLYVPLRVWQETDLDEPSEPGRVDDHLGLLEKFREEGMHCHPSSLAERPGRQRVSVGERLAQSRRLVILGDPGSGKTTLTRWIATAYLLKLNKASDWSALPDVQTLPGGDWLPIIIRCRDLDVQCLNGNLDDMLRHILRKAELSEVEASGLRSLLKTRLQEGRAILMLDGLDEITDPQARACFCAQLENIVMAYPNASIIATSRIVGYREMGYQLGRGFEHLTLSDLTPEEKDDFAKRWCELTELPERRELATKELISDIHSADRIERLTGNPMLLTTMALVKRKIGKLPNRRADLYWEAVQVLLNWRREVDEPLDWHEAIPQLEYLAYAMCDMGVQQLHQDAVVELFVRMRSECPNVHPAKRRSPEEFLKHIEARTGILVEAGHKRHLGRVVPVYEFRHLTFQEYLAARALVDRRFPGRDSKGPLSEIVKPLAGRTVEMSYTKDGPAEAAVVENWSEALRLCTSICNDDDVDDVLLAILTPIEDEPLATARARTTQAALCLADEPNVSDQTAEKICKELASKVGDGDGEGRVKTRIDAAAIELARTRWQKALISALLKEFIERKATVRWNPGGLAAMLSCRNAPQDEQELIKWLNEQVKRLKDGQEIEAIDAALTIMHLAFEGRAIFIPGLVEPLLDRLLGSDSMAHAAAWALSWLNGRNTEERRVWKPTAYEFKKIVAFATKSKADPNALRHLTWIFRHEKDKSAVDPLVRMLKSPFSQLRCSAIDALGEIKSVDAVRHVNACLDDRQPNVRRAAAKALGLIKKGISVDRLIGALNDTDAGFRYEAARALGRVKNKLAVAPLTKHLDDADAKVRHAVACSLSEIYCEQSELDKAIDVFEHVSASDPENTSIYYEIALLYRNKRMFKNAIDACEKIVKIEHNDKEALNGLGYLYLLISDLDKSEHYLLRAIDVYPDYYLALLNLGIVKYRLGSKKDAISYFNKALNVLEKLKCEDKLTEGWLKIALGDVDIGLEIISSQMKKSFSRGELFNLLDWTNSLISSVAPPSGFERLIQLVKDVTHLGKQPSVSTGRGRTKVTR